MVRTLQTFPDKEVGEFYNKNYINVKLQLDTTSNDSDEIKRWFADARMIATEAAVAAYPTILYFNPDGKLIDRLVGFSDARHFIEAGENAMVPGKQYKTLIEKYKANPGDAAILHALAIKANELYDEPLAGELSKKYLTIDKSITPDQVNFLLTFTTSSAAPGFLLAQNYPDEIDAVAGKGSAFQLVKGIISNEELIPYFEKSGGEAREIDWNDATVKLKSKYPAYADAVIRQGRLLSVNMEANPLHKIELAEKIIKDCKSKISADEYAEMLNVLAVTTIGGNDKLLLQQGLKWSNEELGYQYQDRKRNGNSRGINAIILYKLGQRQKAIIMQSKALTFMHKNDPDYIDSSNILNKMKKGVKNILAD
jgi:tetratricopeptide (TPR) repeat protein